MNEKQQQDYEKYVKQVTPTHNLGLQMLKAFVTGGMICCIGQFILNYCEKLGLDKQSAGSWCSLLLVLCSVVLTGFNLYPKIVKWGARGLLCPLPDLPTPWRPLPSSTRRKARSLEWAARFSPSPGR